MDPKKLALESIKNDGMQTLAKTRLAQSKKTVGFMDKSIKELVHYIGNDIHINTKDWI